MVQSSRADLLISGEWLVVSPDQILQNSGVVLADDTILEVGPTAHLKQKYPTAQQRGGAGRLVMPGLVNTHTHLFQTFLKGLGQGLLLRPWIRRITTPAALAMTPREAYLSAAVGLMEALRSGTTAVFEYSYAYPNPELHQATLQAFVDIGLRGWLGLGLNDAGEAFGVHPALIQPLAQGLARAESLDHLITQTAQGRVELALTPSSLRGLSPEGLRQIATYAQARQLILSLHVNETDHDNKVTLEHYGTRAIPWLADQAVLGPQFLAVHCVQLDQTDIQLLAEHQAAVSHNPVSNMYLGSGIAPVVAMRQAGVTVGLGSDGAASNNTQDMLETVKMTALGQRAVERSPVALTASETFMLATQGGADALGRSRSLGQLAPGYQADIVVARTNTPKTTPVHDPLASLVFSAGEENIETVIVAGQIVLDEGQLTSVDEAALMAEAQSAARKLIERANIR